MRVLVSGGAGYIGSHACKALAAAGYVPVTYDNLCTGWREAVKFGPFEQGDLMDRARLDEIFAIHRPVAVMHFAALSQVGEAMREPGKYWRGNVCASLNLIEATIAAGGTAARRCAGGVHPLRWGPCRRGTCAATAVVRSS